MCGFYCFFHFDFLVLYSSCLSVWSCLSALSSALRSTTINVTVTSSKVFIRRAQCPTKPVCGDTVNLPDVCITFYPAVIHIHMALSVNRNRVSVTSPRRITVGNPSLLLLSQFIKFHGQCSSPETFSAHVVHITQEMPQCVLVSG